jgi:undecaprenyl-diphosphatase
MLLTATSGIIRSIDVSVYTYLNSFAGDWLLDRIVSGEESNQLLKGGLFLATYWYFWHRRDSGQDERRHQIVAIVAAVLASLVVARVLALTLPFRVRPMFTPGLPHGTFAVPIQPNMESWSAFPSDTAAYFCGLAFGIAWLRRWVGIPLLVFAGGYVCLPRLYIGLHYLSDIVAGAAIAIVMVWWAVHSEWVKNKVAAPVMRLLDAEPGLFYGAAFLLSMEMANTFDSVRRVAHGVLHAIRVGPHHGAVLITVALSLAALVAIAVLYTIAWRRRDRHTTHLAHR